MIFAHGSLGELRVLSGIMPTGSLHLGNYLGAMLNRVRLQLTHDAFYCVVDLHALTTPQDPTELKETIHEVASLFLAAGVDPARSTIFVQSDVPAHPERCWILNCLTPMAGWRG
jgi:tryptophanyl-tRNA synthetase